jgi:hypothetical protein
MPVKLSRKQPAIFHSMSKQRHQPQQLRRMPIASSYSSSSHSPFTTSEEFRMAADSRATRETMEEARARREAVEVVPETTISSKKMNAFNYQPKCVSLSVPKTHILSPLGNSRKSILNKHHLTNNVQTIKSRLEKTKQNYKDKLTLVKAKLKQKKHFRRSHQRYVVPTQPPTSNEYRMVQPPPTSTPPTTQQRKITSPRYFSSVVSHHLKIEEEKRKSNKDKYHQQQDTSKCNPL